MKDKFLKDGLLGDFSGALSAAIITMPMAIGYGIIAFSALGNMFVPQAAMAGIYSAVFAGFFASLFGGSPIQITGPKAPLTLIYASLITDLVLMHAISNQINSTFLVIGLASICLFIGGISQIIWGAIGVGNLIKYVPQPVISGFMNGIAILLMATQLRKMIDLDNSRSIWIVLKQLALINPLTIIVGLATVFLVFLSKQYVKKIPASLLALIGGTALFYLLASIMNFSIAGLTIGKIEFQFPGLPMFTNFLYLIDYIDIKVIVPKLLLTGMLLGLFSSMESLMSSVAADNLTGTRHNSKKELIGQGIGNIVSASFGAIPAAGSVPRSIANYKAGGRTRLSGIMCSIIIFIAIVSFSPIIGKIPLPVISGIIFVVGWTLIDQGTVKIIKKIIISRNYNNALLVNISITLIVAIITISVDLVTAILIGILIASALFILSLTQKSIKRKYYATMIHSRKRRTAQNIEWLEKNGGEIVVLELQGSLFFGSAENLAIEIEKLLKVSTYCILNFKRVSEIDSTAANILIQLKKSLQSKGKYFLLSQLSKNDRVLDFLEIMDMTKDLVDQFTFSDTDSALEWAEDHLLERYQRRQRIREEIKLSESEVFKDFSEQELKLIRDKMISLTFKKDETVFKEGDKTKDLFILTQGAMSVKIFLPEQDNNKRLFTYTPGTVFGEMAFLDGKPRSASVVASEESKVLCLPYNKFKHLTKMNSGLATKLVINIALEISGRLRRTSNQVRFLEDN